MSNTDCEDGIGAGEVRVETDSAMETDTDAAVPPSEVTDGLPEVSPEPREATPGVDSHLPSPSAAPATVGQDSQQLVSRRSFLRT